MVTEPTWSTIPLTSDDKRFWEVGNEPAIHRADRSNKAEVEGILTHCRQYPEQWEVIEPETTELAVVAVNFAHESMNDGRDKPLMVVLDTDLFSEIPNESKEKMRLLINDIARKGRSSRVNMTLVE